MPRPRRLYKTTLVIWSEFDPRRMENATLGRESDEGEAWSEPRRTELVDDPEYFPDTDFFHRDE
jgi:hypothetical protein